MISLYHTALFFYVFLLYESIKQAEDIDISYREYVFIHYPVRWPGEDRDTAEPRKSASLRTGRQGLSLYHAALWRLLPLFIFVRACDCINKLRVGFC